MIHQMFTFVLLCMLASRFGFAQTEDGILAAEFRMKSPPSSGDTTYLPGVGPLGSSELDSVNIIARSFYPALQEWYSQASGGQWLLQKESTVWVVAGYNACSGIEVFALRFDSGIAPNLRTIELVLYDGKAERFGGLVPVGVAFADGTSRTRQDGWLVDVDSDGCRDLVRREKRWDLDAGGLYSDSLTVRLWKARGFSVVELSYPGLREHFDFDAQW
jgi:hypothetical protein